MTLLATRNTFSPSPGVQIHSFPLIVSRAAGLELQPQGDTIAPQMLKDATSHPMACREAGDGNACLTKSGNLNKMNSKGPILCLGAPSTDSTLPVAGTPPSARHLAHGRSALPLRKGLCNNLNLICRGHEVLRGHAEYQSHIF